MKVAGLVFCAVALATAVRLRQTWFSVAMAAAIFWLGWQVERMICRR